MFSPTELAREVWLAAATALVLYHLYHFSCYTQAIYNENLELFFRV